MRFAGLLRFSVGSFAVTLASALLLGQSNTAFLFSKPNGFLLAVQGFPPGAHFRRDTTTKSKAAVSRSNAPAAGPNFAPVVDYGSGGVGAYAVTVGDMNGDGTPDLAVANDSADSSAPPLPSLNTAPPRHRLGQFNSNARIPGVAALCVGAPKPFAESFE